MRRRAFGSRAAAFAMGVVAPRLAFGASLPRIAWMSGSKHDPQSVFVESLKAGLTELGRVEGRDYRIELHWGDDSRERFDPLVADVLRSKPDLIVTQGPIVFAVQRSGTLVPALFAFSGDPVEARLVDSLARPGRNLSGISMMALELAGKRMEALAETVPGLKRVAVLTNPAHAGERRELEVSQAAAARLGLGVEYLPFEGDAGAERSLSAALRAGCEAMMVFPDGSMMRRSEMFARFAIQNRMPAASGWAEFARRGNLLSYGPNVRQVYRRLASYVDRVLRGAKPAELPVELPTVVEHVINLRSARAMSLAIPRTALLRADDLIS
jgi:putative tryptophan/tyrosine transport system substrate-binding protein